MSNVWSGAETKLEVPMELMDNPLGFTIDAGGSLTKVIYRSREDFADGKPIRGQEKGTLRLRCSNMGHQEELLKFLSENCDQSLDPQRSNTYFLTGITTQFFKKKMEEQFGIKTELMSELTALETGFTHAKQLGLKCYKTSEEVFTGCKKAMHSVIQDSRWKAKESSETNGDPKLDSSNPEAIQGSPFPVLVSDLLSCVEPNEWIEKHWAQETAIEAPALLMLAGSMIVVNLMGKDNKMETVDYVEVAGKTLCGLAEELLGVKDFDEIMQMADTGDSSKVNTTVGDIANRGHKEDDWYAYLDQGFTIYNLGKLSSCCATGKSSYSKEDLAAGLIETVAKVASKLAFLNARLYKVDKVYVCGSLARCAVFRRALEGHFAVSSLYSLLQGFPFVRLFCMENPGFLCAFGTWVRNVKEMEKFQIE